MTKRTDDNHGLGCELHYQTQYTDPTTGDVLAQSRWYSPSSATLGSRDTWAGDLNTPVSLNRYGQNNPIWYSDPSGKCVQSISVSSDGNVSYVPMRGAECNILDARTSGGTGDVAQKTNFELSERDRLNGFGATHGSYDGSIALLTDCEQTVGSCNSPVKFDCALWGWATLGCVGNGAINVFNEAVDTAYDLGGCASQQGCGQVIERVEATIDMAHCGAGVTNRTCFSEVVVPTAQACGGGAQAIECVSTAGGRAPLGMD